MSELSYEDVPAERKQIAETGSVYGAGGDTVMSSSTTLAPRIPQPHGGAIAPFDSARATAAVKRRWELKGEAVRRGIARAAAQVDTIGREDDLEMVSAIMENQALRAYDASTPGSSAAARLVLEHGYPTPAKLEQVDAAPGSDLAELLAAWRQAKQDNPELGTRAAGLLRDVDSE